MQAQRAQLPDGRWHFQHGPIDIIIGADGDAGALKHAHAQAWQRFSAILQELVQELSALRRPIHGDCPVQGPIARRMWLACRPYQNSLITPMAAVAGSVAQELLQFYQAAGINRAWINNGGDIAIRLAANQSVRIGCYTSLERFNAEQLKNGITLDQQIEICSDSDVRGVATSGWRGRSFSLGIADSVTVLACTAAQADAAATVIANAINIDDARVIRRPACSVKDDSDLGNRLVTVDVPPLPPRLIQRALAAGLASALTLRAKGLVSSAVMVCQNYRVTTDAVLQPMPETSLTLAA
jgi:ApbE superfamily uncharacterized protein (UPF0280 family)